MPVEKKLKTSSIVREDPPTAERPVIDMTSSNEKKNKAARSELVAPAMSRTANTITDMIAQCRGHVMPPMPKSVPRHPLGAKSGSPLERLAIMKSDKVDSAAEVGPRPTPPAVETDSPAEKEETALVGSCEKSIKPVSGEAAEICVLLKPDLLDDVDACAKFVDDVRKVVYPSFFAKHTTEYGKTALLAMMQKTAISAAESMPLDQEDIKAAKEVAKVVAAEAYSSSDKIKRLESELVALKGSNISAPTSLQFRFKILSVPFMSREVRTLLMQRMKS